MNNKHVEGALDQAKGRVKEEIGHATGNNKLAGEGVADRVVGKIKDAVGDIKDKVKEKTDQLLSKH